MGGNSRNPDLITKYELFFSFEETFDSDQRIGKMELPQTLMKRFKKYLRYERSDERQETKKPLERGRRRPNRPPSTRDEDDEVDCFSVLLE